MPLILHKRGFSKDKSSCNSERSEAQPKNLAAGAFIIMPLSTLFTAVYSRGGVRGISSAEHAVVFIHLVNKSSREIQKIVESSTTCDRDGSL